MAASDTRGVATAPCSGGLPIPGVILDGIDTIGAPTVGGNTAIGIGTVADDVRGASGTRTAPATLIGDNAGNKIGCDVVVGRAPARMLVGVGAIDAVTGVVTFGNVALNNGCVAELFANNVVFRLDPTGVVDVNEIEGFISVC
jgi:hypothetical protein